MRIVYKRKRYVTAYRYIIVCCSFCVFISCKVPPHAQLFYIRHLSCERPPFLKAIAFIRIYLSSVTQISNWRNFYRNFKLAFLFSIWFKYFDSYYYFFSNVVAWLDWLTLYWNIYKLTQSRLQTRFFLHHVSVSSINGILFTAVLSCLIYSPGTNPVSAQVFLYVAFLSLLPMGYYLHHFFLAWFTV